MATPSSHTKSRSRSSPNRPHPPRPPNAWILYRSDKLKEFPPPGPGERRRAQAEISRIISKMWQNETPEVRAYYERLSEIKKAEHLIQHPGYRFQPMKRAEKDRVKAEKQAEKERERNARKAKTRARKQPPPPLFTTEARMTPAGPSSPASTASSPSNSITPTSATAPDVVPATPASTPSSGLTPQTDPGSVSTPQSTPSSPFVAPPALNSPSMMLPPWPTPPQLVPTPASFLALSNPSSPYPPPPAAPTLFPPLLAPQPGVPQRPPTAADWPQNQQMFNPQAQAPADVQMPDLPSVDMVSSLLDIPFPDPSTGMDFLDVSPSTSHPPYQPLGWAPGDPSPLTDTPSYLDNALRAVLEYTNNPGVYNLLDLNVNGFTGSEPIDVEFTAGAIPFGKLDYGPDFSGLFDNCQPESANGLGDALFLSNGVVNSEGMGFCNFEDLAKALQPQNEVEENNGTPTTGHVNASPPSTGSNRFEAPQRYVPPAGAVNASTRRVAASWRPMQLTPDSD